jgi:hypothetical protein
VTKNYQSEWEEVVRTIPVHLADAAEENATELGYEPGTAAFYAECIGQVME